MLLYEFFNSILELMFNLNILQRFVLFFISSKIFLVNNSHIIILTNLFKIKVLFLQCKNCHNLNLCIILLTN